MGKPDPPNEQRPVFHGGHPLGLPAWNAETGGRSGPMRTPVSGEG